ncbi:MAG: LacI family DNA-binding transcriptional regulator [Aeromicrobium sp.]
MSSRDVAEAAGVSRTTVSFVLNDRPNVSIPESTRQRIWDAANRLGYTPSPEARALKLGRSQIVLCLLPDWPITGPVGVFLGQLSAELSATGLTLLAHQRSPGEDLAKALAAVTPAAILSICDLDASEVELTERRGIPLRAWMANVPGHPDDASLRQVDVGAAQVTALAELGHARVAYLLPADPQLDWFSIPRLQGAQEAGGRLGVDVREHRHSEESSTLPSWLKAGVSEGVTAIATYNDEVAFSVLMAAQQVGLTVPDDLGIIGVDDSFISRTSRPTLSTVSFNPGFEARRIALLIADPQLTETKPVDTSTVASVILRDSTAPPGP